MEGEGARLILKSHYVKAGNNKKGGTSRYASYIATREGAVKIAESTREEEATNAQKKFIDQLITDFPESKNSMSYFMFQKNGKLGEASDFIDDTIDRYSAEVIGMDGYAQYMATRPGAIKIRDTGLFSDGDEPVDLDEVMEELKNYRGNVYMPIISLRPEDSIGYGYDNPESWHNLICKHRDEIAREYRIPADHLRWVGAYHNAVNADGYEHNHIHLILWSTNPNDGWQSTFTGNNIRSILAKDIFSEELKQLYIEKTEQRNEIKKEARMNIERLAHSIEDYPYQDNSFAAREFETLAKSLKDIKGRKYYKYMPKEQKQMVNNIQDDLAASDPRIMMMLESWAVTKDKLVKIYSCGQYELPPLSQIKEFNSIKNDILNQAVKYNKSVSRTMKIEKLEKLSEEKKEVLLKRSMDRLANNIARQIGRTAGKVKPEHSPVAKRIKDAEAIDEEIRRSQGVK